MTTDLKKEARERFNKFIKKWCGNYFPHLIDSDENDGEEYRLELDELINKATQAERERSDMKISGVMKEATLAQKERIVKMIAIEADKSFKEDRIFDAGKLILAIQDDH